jgi:hypothetical protein
LADRRVWRSETAFLDAADQNIVRKAPVQIMRRHISYANVASTLALVLAMAGGAYAALAPVRNGVVHTCYRKSGGALRVVSAGARCTRHERALAFDQRGPVGGRGPRGTAGPQGPTGKTAVTGKTGAAGKTGATGKTGAGVTSAALAAGNATCPSGGSSFSSVSGTTYACNGSAAAFASVDATGTVAAHKNLTTVKLGSTPGVYCLTLAVAPSVGVASVRGDAATRGFAEVLIPAAGAACGATGASTAEVLTYDAAGQPSGLPFDVLLN